MTNPNPLGSITIDVWHKAFVVFGSAITIVSLVYSPKFITQKELFLLGMGLFLIGIGEWKNTRSGSQFITQTAYSPFIHIPLRYRVNDRLGVILEILGIIAVIISMSDFFNVTTILKS